MKTDCTQCMKNRPYELLKTSNGWRSEYRLLPVCRDRKVNRQGMNENNIFSNFFF